jgi:phosphoenolpyruvate synthase/pyruvate phosphate dikinase
LRPWAAKGANLGELAGIDGIRVPEAFASPPMHTEMFTQNDVKLQELLEKLAGLKTDEQDRFQKSAAAFVRYWKTQKCRKNVENSITQAFCLRLISGRPLRTFERHCGGPSRPPPLPASRIHI